MARPREFDEEVVLRQALRAFWEHGYDATSVEDLVKATGLGRASLYGAFGDKEQLFRRVMAHYLAESRGEIERATAGRRGKEALEAFLVSRLRGATSCDDPKGCFLQISATTGTSPPLVQEALAQGSAEVNEYLARFLGEARRLGQLAPNKDIHELLTFLGVFVAGLTASAKAGAEAESLRVSIAEVMKMLFVAE